MLITLTKDEAMSLAGIDKAVSADKARPVLQSILIDWEGDDFEFVATDSYKLICKQGRFDVVHEDDDGLDRKGSMLVSDGKAVAKALRQAARSITKTQHNTGSRVVLALCNGDLTVTTTTHSVALTFPQELGTFPKWRPLVPDTHLSWLKGDSPDSNSEGYTAPWPSFNPQYLADICQGLAATSTAVVPVRFLGGGSELKPWGFGWAADGYLRGYGLLMPVRM